MLEQNLRQSDIRGSKSISRCPKMSFVASSYEIHKKNGYIRLPA